MSNPARIVTMMLLAAFVLTGSAALAKDKIDWGKVSGKESDDKKAPDQAKPADDQPPVKVNPALTGDYVDMAKRCRLSDEQQEKIVKILQAKQRALKQWDEKNKQRVESQRKDISEADGEKDKEKERKKLDRIMADRERAGAKFDMMTYRVLTREQLQQWYEYKLWLLVEADLRLITPPLSQEQTDKSKEISNRYAKRIRPGTNLDENNPVKMAVLKEVFKKVLEKPQKKSLEQILLSRPQFK